VQVIRRPRVIVLSTGDELSEPGEAGGTPGVIPDSVSFGVMATAATWGAEVVGRRRLADAPDALRTAAAEALELADVIVVTGGASVGEKDFARAMFDAAGLELVFSKVAIKPGKPVWAGRAGGRIVLGLPGNPTSAMVTARLLLAPLLAGLGGRDPKDALVWRTVALTETLEATGDRETFYRGQSRGTGVAPVGNQDSGSQKALAEADTLIRRRAGEAAAGVGETVEVLDL
jgi:molybdopterin molybdotransferase